MSLTIRYLLSAVLFFQLSVLAAHEQSAQLKTPGKIVTQEMLDVASEIQASDVTAIVRATKELIAFNQRYKEASVDFTKVAIDEWKLTKKQYKLLLMLYEATQRFINIMPQLIAVIVVYSEEKARIESTFTNKKGESLAQLDKDPRFALFAQIKGELSQLGAIFMPLFMEIQMEMDQRDQQKDLMKWMAELHSWIAALSGVLKMSTDTLKAKIASMPE